MSDPIASQTFAERLTQGGIRDVHLGVFDLDAIFRHKMVDAKKAAKLAARGYSFCDVIHAWDTGEVTWDARDMYIDRPCVIHTDTLREWPFGAGAGVCIADFDGAYGQFSPRNQLQAQIDKAGTLGFDILAAFEFEFFLLNETPDSLRAKDFSDLDHFAKANRTYSLQSAAEHDTLLAGLRDCMSTLGVGLDSLHTELGPGCFEAPLVAVRGMRAADDAALFKNFAKAYFRRNGLTAAFMSKLRPDLSGQSGHFHISLTARDGSPAFADPNDPEGLSATARHFLGGLITLMPEFLALTAHTVNAYKRMVPGAWAPTSANWGVQNRTAAVRVINDSPEATRIEFRVPSADTNPHSTMAMCLAAGLWGIETEAAPPAALTGSAYAVDPAPETLFPRSLDEAADRLEVSVIGRQLFGDSFIDHFVRSRRVEALEYRKHVSAWELRRYLEVL